MKIRTKVVAQLKMNSHFLRFILASFRRQLIFRMAAIYLFGILAPQWVSDGHFIYANPLGCNQWRYD